ncbi:hypothetical protein AB0G71_25805 [Streptomyces sp. NPDC020403]|uniref:hypothetical protein n=1 Tax=unclassified Streptomyces TaxID=2593676 RepID=UPI003402C43E
MLQLKELLFPSIVDVSIEMVRVDAQCIADGAVCPVCGVWSNRVHGSCLRFPQMCRAVAEALSSG